MRRECERGHSLILAAMLMGAPALICAASIPNPGERISFNANWLFAKGDPAGAGTNLSYGMLKPWLLANSADLSTGSPPASRPKGTPGGDVAYTQPGCDDSGWRKLNLPHDWGIEGPFKQEYPGETGKLPWWGIGWYRKHFTVPASDSGKQFYLDVDGAMSYAAVWLNGQFVGGWPYGYSSWWVDLTPYLKPGAENVLAIRLDNPPSSSRWYPGGGIYRNVWLVKTAPVHVGHWGTCLTTPEISRESATLNLKVSVENCSKSEAKVKVMTDIYALNPDGKRAGRPIASAAPASLTLAPASTATAALTAIIRNPKLWGLKQPNRYVACTTIEQDGKVIDTYETPFGLRTIKFTADNGFLLNGERVPLNGVCDHHDLGALGAALNPRALERQLELLKEMGCNAIRTSHNPPAPELLDLCDRLGFVVMDEAFDCWVRGKTRNDYHLLFPDWHERDLRALVRRDRNHPCVILWSIGNEISEQGSPAGHKVAGELAAIVRSEDPTRPVTAGCNLTAAGYNGFQKEVDVFGYNYKPGEYGKFRKANPALPLFGSETSSCVSSRGEYFFPVSNSQSQGHVNFQVSSYDLTSPPWATTPDAEFRGQDVAFQRRAGFVVLKHISEAADASRRQRVHRASTDAVDADLVRAKIVGEIAGAGFERGLGNAHDVVVRDDLFGAVVTHADDAAAFRHERRGGPRQSHQRVSANIVRHPKGLAAGINELAFKSVLWRERYRMQQHMQFAKLVTYRLEYICDLVVFGDVARQDQGVGAKGSYQFLNVFLEPFSLIRECEPRARAIPGLRDGPGDRALVRYAENNSQFASQ